VASLVAAVVAVVVVVGSAVDIVKKVLAKNKTLV
jgi:hypothetical protein